MSVMLVPELVKIGPTVQGPMKSWVMQQLRELRQRRDEKIRVLNIKKQSGASVKPVVEQLDSEVAVDNGVQPKSRLDKVAVQDEAEGLKTPEERLQDSS